MARNNIEKEFASKLNEREIMPSEGAWDRLDAMLAVAEQKKPERNFNWLLIAASFLGFLLVGTFIWNQDPENTVPQNNIVVDQNIDKPGTGEDVPTPKLVENHESIAVVTVKKSANQSKPSIRPEQFQSVNQNPVAQIPTENQQSANQSDQKSYPQADELLAIAQSKTSAKTSVVKVNAKSLLSQVDGETDLSLSQKIIHKVGQNYQNVKVALSNRNSADENH